MKTPGHFSTAINTGIKQERTDAEWMRVWEAFVIRYAERRANSDAS